jgi:hypothetical protein
VSIGRFQPSMTQDSKERHLQDSLSGGSGISAKGDETTAPNNEYEHMDSPPEKLTTRPPLRNFQQNFLDKDMAPLRKVYFKVVIPAVLVSVAPLPCLEYRLSPFSKADVTALIVAFQHLYLVLCDPEYLLGGTLECKPAPFDPFFLSWNEESDCRMWYRPQTSPTAWKHGSLTMTGEMSVRLLCKLSSKRQALRDRSAGRSNLRLASLEASMAPRTRSNRRSCKMESGQWL